MTGVAYVDSIINSGDYCSLSKLTRWCLCEKTLIPRIPEKGLDKLREKNVGYNNLLTKESYFVFVAASLFCLCLYIYIFNSSGIYLYTN